MNHKLIEGVSYYRYIVRYKLVDGRRRKLVRWSPGFPWVRAEVVRELADLHGLDGISPGSVFIYLALPPKDDTVRLSA